MVHGLRCDLLAASCRVVGLAGLLSLGLHLPAAAETATSQLPVSHPELCPYQTFGQELRNPREVRPDDRNVLHLEFVARVVEAACVPGFGLQTCACTEGNCPAGCACAAPFTYDAATNTCTGTGNPPAPTCPSGQQWSMNKMPLRMWGTSLDPSKKIDPDDGADPNTVYAYPGPTMRVRKSDEGKHNGTRLKINLFNRLPFQNVPSDPDACSPQCVIEPPKPIGNADPKLYPEGQLVCINHPDCFHGPNVTNMHFHGTHISPQEHQDFVLLSLYPQGSKSPDAPMHPHGVNQIGDYWYDIDPIPDNQAEGTHWYHPHKHGSTAVQVLNGMSGALLIEGPFDDWLYGLYKVDPRKPEQLQRFEKVMVLQQVWPDVNFYNPNDHLKVYPPALLVNGQAAPVITMRAGEVQRWRFINATMQAGAQLQLQPPPGLTWMQIAQDGVRFAEANYIAQPLYGANGVLTGQLPFSPGQRADFLVQAPAVPGDYHFSHDVVGRVHDRVRDTLDARKVATKAAANGVLTTEDGTVTAGGATLFTIRVIEEPGEAMSFPATSASDPACKDDPKKKKAKPAYCYPAMPAFLADLDPKGAKARNIQFSMEGTAPGVQPNEFTIDGDGYEPDCASQTMTLGATEAWTINNNSPLQHPYHIHINPFQLTRYANTQLSPPWIWFDTVPVVAPAGSSKDTEPCTTTNPCFQYLTKFEDFTGEYVLHCHFLGHEDRGMMENVQVVCPEQPYGKEVFGKPSTYRPECQDGDFRPASKACPAEPVPSSVTSGAKARRGGSHGGHGGHGHGGHGGGQGSGQSGQN